MSTNVKKRLPFPLPTRAKVSPPTDVIPATFDFDTIRPRRYVPAPVEAGRVRDDPSVGEFVAENAAISGTSRKDETVQAGQEVRVVDRSGDTAAVLRAVFEPRGVTVTSCTGREPLSSSGGSPVTGPRPVLVVDVDQASATVLRDASSETGRWCYSAESRRPTGNPPIRRAEPRTCSSRFSTPI